jgi:hypothetical protein
MGKPAKELKLAAEQGAGRTMAGAFAPSNGPGECCDRPGQIQRRSRCNEQLRSGRHIRKPVDFHPFAEAVRQLGLYWLMRQRIGETDETHFEQIV